MFKTLFIALLPVLASTQATFADTNVAATQTATPSTVSLIAVCEGPGAQARDVEPCAAYWTYIHTETSACMAEGSTQREAYRHRFILCSYEIREKYQTAVQ